MEGEEEEDAGEEEDEEEGSLTATRAFTNCH